MATGSSPALPTHTRRRLRRCRHHRSTRRELLPQPPCSPRSPDPSLTRGRETAGLLLLPAGAAVEVRHDGKGYYGIWFEATVVGFAAATARYSVTFGGDGGVRRFAATHVRPRPPAPALHVQSPPRVFRPHDIVEVFHERGWWPGLVLAAAATSVTVAFPITREVVTYVPRLVRPRRDYVAVGGGGAWVPARAVVAAAAAVGRPKRRGIRRYEVGEEVEVVSRDREMNGHSWSPAKVAEVIDGFSYIVEYSDQNGDDGGSSEYLHWQFIRPAVQHLPPEDDEFRRRSRAKRQANFKQTLASGKRPRSHDAECSRAKGLMRTEQKLAVLVQDSETASVSMIATPLYAFEISQTNICPPKSCSLSLYGHSTHTKMVLSDTVENQLERRKPLLYKVYTSKKRLSKKNKVLEEAHNLHNPLEMPSTDQKIAVNEIAGPQREPSLALDRSESTQQQLGSMLEDTVNANEVKYHEPVAVVPLSFESASDDIDIKGSKFDEGLISQDNRIIDVLTLVKNSCLWSTVSDVFKEFPQQPHFIPIQQQYPHTMQGGMAFGLMMAFDLFVRRITKSSIVDSVGSFEAEKSTLATLKSNGFDVQYFECLLDRLIKVKLEYSKHLEDKSEVQTQKQQTMSSFSRNDLLLCEIDNDIAELQKKLGLLRQKGQLIEKEKEHEEEKLSRLDLVERNIEEALDVDTLQFNGILAEVKQKCLT